MDARTIQQGRPPVIGIAGGVGSGKSTVAAILDSLGCLVLNADEQAKTILDTPDVRTEIVKWWGEVVLADDGSVDRSVVASIVFADPQQLRRLESILHHRVIQMQKDAIENADPAVTPAVVLDIPLLFEAGMDAECDAILFVDTPEADRLARVQATRGWDEAELTRRQASQWPLEAKKTKSDFVVMNGGDEADLKIQVREVFERIRSTPEP